MGPAIDAGPRLPQGWILYPPARWQVRTHVSISRTFPYASKLPPSPGQRLAQRKARKEKQGQIRFCTPNNRRSRYAETQFHDRPGKAQGRRGCRYAPDRFARPSLHEETARTGRLFVSAIFSSTGRGAFSFGKTKENGGRIPRGDPAPPSRPAGKRDIPRTPLPETLAADCLLTPRCGPAATAAPNTASAGGRWPPWPGWRHRPPPGSAAPAPGSGPCTARPGPSATGRRA